MRLLSIPLAIGAMLFSVGAQAAEPAPNPQDVKFFEEKIRPLLAERCYSCHSEAGKAKGGLMLDTRANLLKGGNGGPAIVPGAPDKSHLLTAVGYKDEELQMPPPSEGKKLTDAQVADLTEWIKRGAYDPRDGESKKLSGLTKEARAHWAYQPVKKPSVPADKSDKWARNEVDSFILAKLKQNGMKPSTPAARETLLRRISYDMTGLPPTLDEIQSFVDDSAPNAYEKVVDRLLASPQYGERWGRHWLDSARYSDTRGVNSNNGRQKFDDYRFPFAWTYRDYVIKAFNDDKPYNDFLVEQIAADKLPDLKDEDPRLAALGFLSVGKRFENNDDLIDERIDTVTKATLGITVSCARCHDHKFDPVPITDYYSLHGIFASTIEPYEKPYLPFKCDPADRADFDQKLVEIEKRNRGVIFQILRDRMPEFQANAEGYLLLLSEKRNSTERFDIGKKYNLNPENREIIETVRLTPDSPVLGPFFQLMKLPKDDTWPTKAAELLGKIMNNPKKPFNPIVTAALKDLKPKDLTEVAKIYGGIFAKAQTHADAFFYAQMTPGAPPAPINDAWTEIVGIPFCVPSYDEIATIEQQVAFLTERKHYKPWQQNLQLDPNFGENYGKLLFTAVNELRLRHPGSPARAMVLNDAPKANDSYVFIRGDRNKKGPVVPRRFLEMLSPEDRPAYKEGSGRLELAKNIADPKNPLTARVIVNRVWMHHFGDGFVRTPDDMGVMSEPPSHPELLDWLTATFVENGWSIKKLHRMILLSNTYQQACDTNKAYAEKDSGNRLLWRANLRRLDFEAIRDSMVMLTGKMDTTLGGKPVNITDEPYSYRRSVYGYVDRLFLSDLMRQFDFADPDMPNTKRISTIVPQQALFFMNSSMSVDVARHITSRPEFTGAANNSEKVRAIYRMLFQREPRSTEVALADEFITAAEKTYVPPPVKAKPKPLPATISLAKAVSSETKREPSRNGVMVTTMAMAGVPAPMENTAAAANSMSGGAMAGNAMAGAPAAKPSTGMGMAAPPKVRSMATDKFMMLQNVGEKVERRKLSPWETYTQALLCSNEFVYVE